MLFNVFIDYKTVDVKQRIQAYLTSKDELEPVSRIALLGRVGDGLVTVLDVRPPEEYAAGHVPGAVNVSLKELPKRLREFKRNSEIVAYCRSPICATKPPRASSSEDSTSWKLPASLGIKTGCRSCASVPDLLRS